MQWKQTKVKQIMIKYEKIIDIFLLHLGLKYNEKFCLQEVDADVRLS